MLEIDWNSLLVPSGSLAEIFVRGTFIYLLLFAAMRLLPRRTIGAMGPSDLLVVVLIADAVQNAMSGSYESVSEGVVLAATIFGWSTLIDWLDYRFPHLNLASAKPLQVIANGQLLRHNMRRQQITEEEVMSQLREHGLDSPRNVVGAFVEGDGHFSVLVRGGAPIRPPERRQL